MENKPMLIKTWAELKMCESDTHVLEINDKFNCGWIRAKDGDENKLEHYLSTHTFYDSNYQASTEILQKCGFNVQLTNGDVETE